MPQMSPMNWVIILTTFLFLSSTQMMNLSLHLIWGSPSKTPYTKNLKTISILN